MSLVLVTPTAGRIERDHSIENPGVSGHGEKQIAIKIQEISGARYQSKRLL
jgi:hypothetical protein